MTTHDYDLLIIGAGTAGLACAIEAMPRGLRILVVEQSDRIGGTLHVSSAQMSAAGTKLQRSRGIDDSPDRHYEDIVRITRGTADLALVRKAVDLAPNTIDWLCDNGFAMAPECPAILHLHEAYRTPRTYWGVDGGRSVLAVLTRLFEAARAQSSLELRFRTTLESLVQDERGNVVGARLRSDALAVATMVVTARAVVLTTGGYAGNAETFARLHDGAPLCTVAPETATGHGIDCTLAIGATVRNASYWQPMLGAIEDPPGSGRAVWADVPLMTPQQRAPWEIYVDANGQRFVREDEPSVDIRERALAKTPGMRCWIVFDQRIADQAPPLFPQWTRERFVAMFESHPAFVRAPDPDALARRIGANASDLRATITAYNQGVDSGRDPLGRMHQPLPIASAPFYAIACRGFAIRTSAGIRVDDQLRVLKGDGAPIDGLYAAGEILGGGALSGNTYVGGMSVTPALGFGRWLGRTLLS